MSTFNQSGPLSAHRLFALQLELECKAIDHANQLQCIPCANPDDVPRYLIVTDGTTYTSYVDADLPAAVRGPSSALRPSRRFTTHSSSTPSWAATHSTLSDLHGCCAAQRGPIP